MKSKHTEIRKCIRRRFIASVAALLTLLAPAVQVRAADADLIPQVITENRAQPFYSTVPVYIDGVRCPSDAYIIENGVTYLPLRTLAEQLLPGANIYWDSKNGCAAVKTDTLTLTAAPGNIYITANGRYLALSALHPAPNTLVNGVT